MHNLPSWAKKTLPSVVLTLVLSVAFSLPVGAFDPNQVLRDSDFNYLPIRFASAEKIQQFLEYEGSVLATMKVPISFHHDENPTNCDQNDYWYLKGYADCKGEVDDTDIMISPDIFPNQPQRLIPYYAMQPYYNTEMRVSDFIWELSRGDLNNGCSFGADGVCIDHTVNPINPAFVLAIIQKESGLVRGACSQPDADTNPNCHFSQHHGNYKPLSSRIERAAGYTCYETSDKTRGCYDENPNWKYYKGFFSQVYYSARWFRIWVNRCDMGKDYGHLGNFYTGNTVTIDNQQVYLSNGITCAMYIYTPHISETTAKVLSGIQGDVDFVEETGRDINHQPAAVELF